MAGPMRRSWWLPAIAAFLAVIVRLPLLARGDAFFNSDEAIEGLMAFHVSDLPRGFWGQGYKGVPEVYLHGSVFSLFGAGIIQMKSVTVGLWAIAVALVTRLAQRWHGERVALMTAAIFVTGPPALAFWSLSA